MLGPRRFGRFLALLAFVSILALVAAMPAPAAPVVTATNPVTDWNLTAVNTPATLPGPAGGAPPASQISVGWSRAPSTTRSTRSRPSIIDPICSSAVSPRPLRRTPLSRQRRTWSCRTFSRPCPRASCSRPGRSCSVARVAIRRLAGCDTRLAAQDQGSRRRERGGGGDDRCP